MKTKQTENAEQKNDLYYCKYKIERSTSNKFKIKVLN